MTTHCSPGFICWSGSVRCQVAALLVVVLCADAAVTCEEREKAKKVTYGIVYGLSAWGLAKGPAGLGIEVSQAQTLISSFLNHFGGVQTDHCCSHCACSTYIAIHARTSSSAGHMQLCLILQPEKQ